MADLLFNPAPCGTRSSGGASRCPGGLAESFLTYLPGSPCRRSGSRSKEAPSKQRHNGAPFSCSAGHRTLVVNDVSLPQGGNTTDHKGHEAGLQVDIRPTRKDGGITGTTHTADAYDRESMRALLQSIGTTPTVGAVFFNDPVLIGEGLCAALAGHNDHAHVAVQARERLD